MNIKISVVICTFNRAELLSDCLESLAAQTLGINLYEVIVVDNNSTDATLQVAGEFAARIRNLRIVTERQQGLSRARNRGWREAHGSFVAYIDDDARASTDWLAQMWSFIERWPEVSVFGGPYSPRAEVPLPSWFPPRYGVLNFGDQDRVLDPQSEFLSGTNMVFSRSLLETIGGFNSHLGMVGKKVAYGEETRILRDISELGVRAYYAPAMRVFHLIASSKFSLRWLFYSSFCKGRDVTAAVRKGRKLRSHLYGVAGEFVKAFYRLMKGVNMPLKRSIFHAFDGFFTELGALVGCITSKIHG